MEGGKEPCCRIEDRRAEEGQDEVSWILSGDGVG